MKRKASRLESRQCENVSPARLLLLLLPLLLYLPLFLAEISIYFGSENRRELRVDVVIFLSSLARNDRDSILRLQVAARLAQTRRKTRKNGSSDEMLKTRGRVVCRVAKIAKFRGGDSLQSLTYLACSWPVSACFHDPIPLTPSTYILPLRLRSWIRRRGEGARGTERRRRQADGRLQQHGERTKCSFVVALHTGNFINCAFCYADACRPSQPPSPPFLLPPLSSTESKTSFSFSLFLFFFLSTWLVCPRIFKRLPSLAFSLSLSLSQICYLQSDESSSTLPFLV